ncbi:MAG: hypothetical protein NWQ54_01930 [Paraglaciecola sp.]|nr:hypothetical protein [Paraglaciecola sp.]MDP5029067.1 hypothetical protein [Paraglaciecola sp.]MDP5129612.1 hypothetical protein [Paraglaciecola sp.]
MFSPLFVALVMVISPMLAYALGALLFSMFECKKMKSTSKVKAQA